MTRVQAAHVPARWLFAWALAIASMLVAPSVFAATRSYVPAIGKTSRRYTAASHSVRCATRTTTRRTSCASQERSPPGPSSHGARPGVAGAVSGHAAGRATADGRGAAPSRTRTSGAAGGRPCPRRQFGVALLLQRPREPRRGAAAQSAVAGRPLDPGHALRRGTRRSTGATRARARGCVPCRSRRSSAGQCGQARAASSGGPTCICRTRHPRQVSSRGCCRGVHEQRADPRVGWLSVASSPTRSCPDCAAQPT
jgi:hypothetical protein